MLRGNRKGSRAGTEAEALCAAQQLQAPTPRFEPFVGDPDLDRG